MKQYRQLVKELPSKKVVFAFGRFQPPTTGHELLVNAVKKLAGSTADHVIYASKTEDKKSNPLPVARKVYFLKRMFPKTNFLAASAEVRTPIEAAKELNKKYKNIVLVAGSDRVASFQKLLNDYNGKEYNFDTIEVVSAGERDPDSDTASGMSGTKMREAAVAGDFNKFKKGLPHTLTELDGRRLMNDIRKGMGHSIIKEQFIVQKDDLREKYFNGEIFNIGDIVESFDIQYEIVKRGSNHLLLKQEDGSLVSKWIQDVTIVEELKMNEELSDKTIKGSDKIKVARIIANTLGVENAEATSDPTQLVNSGLRKVRGKAFNADSLKIIGKMLELASEVGIQYDNNLVPTKLKEDLDEADLEKFKKYTRPVVKTTPKIERTTNPAGRTTDHVEWKVTTPTGEIHRHKTKKEAQAHFDSFSEGTVQPNGTDKIDVLSSAPTDRTKTVYYKDFKKMIQKEEVVEDEIDDLQVTTHPHSHVGHAMSSATDTSNLRHQKIRYRLGEEVELNEEHYEKAEAHRAKAMEAKQKGDAESYHHHMSNHYDSIAQWHDSKGRHNMSDISAKKAEKHHEASINGGKLKKEEVTEEPAMKHRVAVTVSDPNHTAVSKRKEQVQKFAKVTAGSEEDAVKKASAHFKKVGFKIHGAEHHSMVKEDLVNELSNDTLGSYKKKAGEQASAADKVGDTKKADKRFSGIIKATKKQFVNDLRKEDAELEEDIATSEYKIKKFVSGDGKIHQRKIRPKRITFAASTSGGEPAQDKQRDESYYTKVVDALNEAMTAIDKGEYDYEGQMARTQLQTTLRNCKDLIDMVKDDDNMPEWVQSKITLAQDYITTVRDYLQSKEELVAEGLQPDNDPFFDEDADTELSDDDMDDMINNTHDDEFMDAYEDDEFHIIDTETGEPVEDEEEVNEEALMEVLSRSERLRAKMRFAKTKSKRERRMMIVLKTRSNTETLNKRARRMAIQLMKKRIAKKPLSQLSIGEKERLERVIQSRKQLIGRMAMKLTPRMRKIEQNRLSHTKGATGSTNNAF